MRKETLGVRWVGEVARSGVKEEKVEMMIGM